LPLLEENNVDDVEGVDEEVAGWKTPNREGDEGAFQEWVDTIRWVW